MLVYFYLIKQAFYGLPYEVILLLFTFVIFGVVYLHLLGSVRRRKETLISDIKRKINHGLSLYESRLNDVISNVMKRVEKTEYHEMMRERNGVPGFLDLFIKISTEISIVIERYEKITPEELWLEIGRSRPPFYRIISQFTEKEKKYMKEYLYLKILRNELPKYSSAKLQKIKNEIDQDFPDGKLKKQNEML